MSFRRRTTPIVAAITVQARVKHIIPFPLQERAVIIRRRCSRRFGFVVAHFHICVFGWRVVSLGLGPFLGLALLALFVLGCCFVEEGFAVGFDGLLVFLADFGWVVHAVLFVVALDKLLGGLFIVRLADTCIRMGTYLFGKPLEIFFWNLVLVLVDDVLDMRVQLFLSARFNP